MPLTGGIIIIVNVVIISIFLLFYPDYLSNLNVFFSKQDFLFFLISTILVFLIGFLMMFKISATKKFSIMIYCFYYNHLAIIC